MNLWNIWPDFFEELLHIEGILYLPLFTLPCYLFCLYSLLRQSQQRISLGCFFVLTLVASTTMFLSMGPGIGKIFPPLTLLAVMFMPLIMLVIQIVKKDNAGIRIWSMASIAGWLHSLSWWLWLIALAGS